MTPDDRSNSAVRPARERPQALRAPGSWLLHQVDNPASCRVAEKTGLDVAVSAGILTEDQAERFAAGGVHRYNHNLETARSFFPEIVTTHTWDERWETCEMVARHGMELCCGVLLGMGESDAQQPSGPAGGR